MRKNKKKTSSFAKASDGRRKKKIYEITFELCNDSKEIYPAYNKLEAKKMFLTEHRLILDDKTEKTIEIRELSQKEFEKKYFGRVRKY